MLYLQVYRFDFKPAVYITMTTVEEKNPAQKTLDVFQIMQSFKMQQCI